MSTPTPIGTHKLPMLVISWAFAPDREIGAKRITRFCTYLPEYGVRPVVLTGQERFLRHHDNSFLPPKGVRVERTSMLANPVDICGRLKRRLFQTDSASLRSPTHPSVTSQGRAGQRGLKWLMLTLLNSPDQYQGWYVPAVRAANRLIKQERLGAIFSSGPPFTCHLVARHLCKKHGIPWAADFRDGWAMNPQGQGSPRWVLKMHSRMEASCIKRADLVICNTEPLRRSFVERYPQSRETKFVTLTNGYDDAIKPPPVPKSESAKRLFLHFGSLYGRRRIDTFCQAVSSLVKAGKLSAGSFKILFHGEIDAFSLASARKYAPELIASRAIEFEPFMDSWREAQEILWGADVLLVFPGSPLEVPAKFYEYLRTGMPIFAVAEKGALTDLLDLTGSGAWADPSNPAAIASGLLKALQMAPVPPEEVQRRWDERFHFRFLTARLADMLRELSERNAETRG